jgi:hypothetical protein
LRQGHSGSAVAAEAGSGGRAGSLSRAVALTGSAVALVGQVRKMGSETTTG